MWLVECEPWREGLQCGSIPMFPPLQCGSMPMCPPLRQLQLPLLWMSQPTRDAVLVAALATTADDFAAATAVTAPSCCNSHDYNTVTATAATCGAVMPQLPILKPVWRQLLLRPPAAAGAVAAASATVVRGTLPACWQVMYLSMFNSPCNPHHGCTAAQSAHSQ